MRPSVPSRGAASSVVTEAPPKTRVVQFCPETYLATVQASLVPSSVQQTLAAMVNYADGSGETFVSRETVAKSVGLTSVRTITRHWNSARHAGLLRSFPRFNSSSIHVLTIREFVPEGETITGCWGLDWFVEKPEWLNTDTWTYPGDHDSIPPWITDQGPPPF